jgi:hypothetical protein
MNRKLIVKTAFGLLSITMMVLIETLIQIREENKNLLTYQRSVETIKDQENNVLQGKIFGVDYTGKYKTYYNNVYGFKLQLPEEYALYETSGGGRLWFYRKYERTHTHAFEFDFFGDNLPKTLDEITDKFFQSKFSASGPMGSLICEKILSSETLEINGIPAKKFYVEEKITVTLEGEHLETPKYAKNGPVYIYDLRGMGKKEGLLVISPIFADDYNLETDSQALERLALSLEIL